MEDIQWQIGICASFVKEVLMKFYGQVMMDSKHQYSATPIFCNTNILQPIFWKFDYSQIANENENLLSVLKGNNVNITTHINGAAMKVT